MSNETLKNSVAEMLSKGMKYIDIAHYYHLLEDGDMVSESYAKSLVNDEINAII